MKRLIMGIALVTSMSALASDECLNTVRENIHAIKQVAKIQDGYDIEFASATKRNDVSGQRDAAQADRALIEKIRAVAEQVCNELKH